MTQQITFWICCDLDPPIYEWLDQMIIGVGLIFKTSNVPSSFVIVYLNVGQSSLLIMYLVKWVVALFCQHRFVFCVINNKEDNL